MSKRLPQPPDPKRVRLVVSDDELQGLERMAFDTRLSVASYVRALVVFARKTWPEHQAEIKAVAEEIAAGSPPDKRKPGRPKGKGKGK
jgi:hypothetical protein